MAGEINSKHSFVKSRARPVRPSKEDLEHLPRVGRLFSQMLSNVLEGKEKRVKRTLSWFARLAIVLLAGVIGGMVGRNYPSDGRVHAQEKSGMSCTITVPKAWGEFKGASAYGLAFQDPSGTLRFLLHPACGNISSYSEYGSVDLEIQRR